MFLSVQGTESALRKQLALASLLFLVAGVALQFLPSAMTGAQAVAPACMLDSTGLLAHWKLDEGTGTAAADSTGNGHNGTLVNGTTWTSATPVVGFDDPYAASFDGMNDEITAPDTQLALGTQNFTVSAFVKSTVGDRSVLGHFDNTGSGYRGWGMYFYASNRVNFFGYGTMGVNDTSHAATILDNNWHHVAGVYTRTGNSLKIDMYVDGVLKGTNTATVGDMTVTTPMRLGRYTFQPNFSGSLDDVKIFDSALTAAQIANLSAGNCGYFCNGKIATILGTAANNLLNGTAGDDVIMGLGGNDLINAGTGHDTVCGGDGNDIANGGVGNDWVDGNKGNDAVNGNDGTDTLMGGDNNDSLNGGAGTDSTNGGAGTDACSGETVVMCEA